MRFKKNQENFPGAMAIATTKTSQILVSLQSSNCDRGLIPVRGSGNGKLIAKMIALTIPDFFPSPLGEVVMERFDGRHLPRQKL